MNSDNDFFDEFRGVDRQRDKDILINWTDGEEFIPADSSDAKKVVGNQAPLLPSPGTEASPEGSQQLPEVPKKSPIGNISRRFLAYLEDTLLLGLIGVLIGTVFYGLFSRMGGWEIFIGFFIAVAYFGYMNSEKCNGQTWGKKQFKLSVVDKDKNCIPLKTSIFRAIIFMLPFFVFSMISLAGIPVFLSAILMFVLGGVGTVLFTGLVYLSVFNKATWQVPHDLIVNTYVVEKDSAGIIQPQPPKKVHMVIMSVISAVLVLLVLFSSINMFAQSGRGDDSVVNELEATLAKEYPKDKISVSTETSSFNGQKIAICNFRIIGGKIPGNEGETMESFVKNLRSKSSSFGEFDLYRMELYDGYNLGIAAYRSEKEYTYKPSAEGEKEGKSGRRQRNIVYLGPIHFSAFF